MSNHNEIIGYMKYDGELVRDGFLDARKAAKALEGFDEAVRHFVILDVPELENVEFEIPVKVQKGSWEALIPETIGQWIGTGLAIATTTALTTFAKKVTDNSVKDTEWKDVFRKAIDSVKWVVKIAKHTGNFGKQVFVNLKWRNDNKEVGITNGEGETIFVPVEFVEFFKNPPKKLLSKIASVVEVERTLKIGTYSNGEKDEVEIKNNEKYIFFRQEDEEDTLFPELIHNQSVELEGVITRANEKTNTLGFEYKDHILTCKPAKGNIITLKEKIIAQDSEHFFPDIKMIGVVDRRDESGQPNAKRPKIIFLNIVPLGEDDATASLFEL